MQRGYGLLTAGALLVLLYFTSVANAYEQQRISYGDASAQFVELYLPAKVTVPITLVVVNGENWDAVPDRDRLPEPLIRFWTDAGVRLAQVWYRNAGVARYPAQAEDLAAALAKLDSVVSARQVFCLLGMAAGAQLASVIALDPGYVTAAGVSPGKIAGVIGVSGIYDLLPDYALYEGQRKLYSQLFGGIEQRRLASPLALSSGPVPPFLLLTAEDDIHGRAIDARRMSRHLTELGSDASLRILVRGATHDSLQQLHNPDNPAAHFVLDFLRLKDLEENYARVVRMESRWQRPPFTTEPFYALGLDVNSYPMTDQLRSMVKRAFLGQEYRMHEWALNRFQAVDLFDLLDSLGPERVGQGGVLELSNVRGEKLFWKLDDLRPFKPVVVIGLDDEKNLFQVSSFYLGKREYSWEEPEQPVPPMVRSLGAFIYFLKPPPERFYPRYQAQFALTLDSFSLREDDPLTAFADLDVPMFQLITADNGCVSCHMLRGVGASAHHLTAEQAEPHGGYALALESYDPGVWKRFIFEQESVAELIGVSPNVLPPNLGKQLYQLVEDERD